MASETRKPPVASDTREPLSSGGAWETREPPSSRWHQGSRNPPVASDTRNPHSGLGNPGAAVIGRDPGAAVIAMASHEAARKHWSASVATRSGPASTVAEV